MADDIVIRAEGLGKKYIIGHQAERESYTMFRDVLARSVRGLARSARDLVSGRAMVAGDEVEEFWALKDINFEIKRGEVVGIVGRNGAGKSTLLKILSRITEPSDGRVTIRGRVASLLEVGTGFHPELSGRENVYLNGAILGMSHAEIRRKFDEIVAFAEVEKFLDTPVKRYSSGMYVRLAFAVAAHLEPEILVVDEVLAVGDAEFQKKCLGKMQDVAGEGRTVLFVSHNAGAIRKLCQRGIVLESGRLRFFGDVAEAMALYTSRGASSEEWSIDLRRAPRSGSQAVRLTQLDILNLADKPRLTVHEPIQMRFSLEADQAEDMRGANTWLLVRSAAGDDLAIAMQKDSNIILGSAQSHSVMLNLPLDLAPGRYSVACGVLDGNGFVSDWIDDACGFEVDQVFNDGTPFDGRLGVFLPYGHWTKAIA